MENLQIFSIVLCVSGLFGTVEGLTGGENITVICTNESISENEIQLLCNLETFICSSMDVGQEKFTIDQSSIQLSGRKCVFRARAEGAQDSVLSGYSCLSKDWVNMSTVSSTVSDPNTKTVPVPHPGTIFWNKSSNKQPTKPEEELESDWQKEERKRKGKPTHPKCIKDPQAKQCKNNKDNSDEDKRKGGRSEEGNRRGEAGEEDGKGDKSEEGNRRGEAGEEDGKGGRSEEGNRQGEAEEDEGKDLDKPPNNSYPQLDAAIATFAVIAILTVLLLLLASFYFCRWKKRTEQSKLKAGSASVQKLQEEDHEKKVVTVYAKATDSGNPVLPPVYNPTGHIYQEIEDTPQNSAEVMHNPLYISDGRPSQ